MEKVTNLEKIGDPIGDVLRGVERATKKRDTELDPEKAELVERIELLRSRSEVKGYEPDLIDEDTRVVDNFQEANLTYAILDFLLSEAKEFAIMRKIDANGYMYFADIQTISIFYLKNATNPLMLTIKNPRGSATVHLDKSIKIKNVTFFPNKVN